MLAVRCKNYPTTKGTKDIKEYTTIPFVSFVSFVVLFLSLFIRVVRGFFIFLSIDGQEIGGCSQN